MDRVASIAQKENYPKFWATLARLQAVLHQFRNAESSIQKAICEERNRWDSDFRRATYLVIQNQIRLGREAQRLHRLLVRSNKQATEQAEAKLKTLADETRTRHVEILAFFTGALSLVAGGIQAILQGSPKLPAAKDAAATGASAAGGVLQAGSMTPVADAGNTLPTIIPMAGGLLMLAGVMLVVFGGLGWLLRGDRLEVLLRSLVVVFLGAFAFSGGLLALAGLSAHENAARSAAELGLFASGIGACALAVLSYLALGVKWYVRFRARQQMQAT